MPTVIRRNAALATPALESKSTLSRNAAQSPLPTSSIMAVAPPSPSTIAAGPNRRRRIARSTSAVAITSLPCRPSPIGTAGSIGPASIGSGSMRLVDAQQAGHDEQRHRQQRHRHHGEVRLHADVGAVDEHGDDAARHRAEAPQAVQSVHHRDAPARAEQLGALHVHRHVDEDVEEQQADQADDEHRRRRSRTRRSAASRSTGSCRRSPRCACRTGRSRGPVSRLPIKPEMLASVRTSPSPPIEMPTRSRISGNSGMNDA